MIRLKDPLLVMRLVDGCMQRTPVDVESQWVIEAEA